MSENTSGFTEGFAVGQGMNNGGYGGGFGWGGDWIAIILLAALFGNGGFGFGGGGGGNVFGEVQRGFDTTGINNKLNGLENGLCDGFYAQNTNLLTGFANISREIADCCCTTQRAIDNVNYNLATQSCETRRAIEDNTNKILGFLTNEKIESLRAENTALTAQLSQNAQTRAILDELRPVARPAYITCSPYQSVFGWNGAAGNGYSCGCGCS